MKKILWVLFLSLGVGWLSQVPLQAGEKQGTNHTDQEIEAISSQLKNATAPASDQTKSIGPFKYSANQAGLQKLLPDISLIGNFAGAYFSTDPTGATGVDPAKTGFNLQEIELALQSVIDPYLRADVMLAFSEDTVELEEGYFTTLAFPKGFQMRGGKFRLPFGRQNQKHTENWDFADNALMNKYVLGPDGLKELGVEVSYLIPLPFFLQLQGTFSNGDGDASFGGTRKQDFLYQGRLSTSFDVLENSSILFGTSAAFGFNNTGLGNQTQVFGGDVLFKWKPKAYRSLVWQSEYLFRSFEDGSSRQKDGGLYSYVDYQFLKRWHAGMRYDQTGLPSYLIAKEYRVTPALTFNPTEFTRLRVQYEYDKVASLDPIHSAFLQLEFSMGPHGGHPF